MLAHTSATAPWADRA